MHFMKPISPWNSFSAVVHDLRSDEGIEVGLNNAVEGTEALGMDEKSRT